MLFTIAIILFILWALGFFIFLKINLHLGDLDLLGRVDNFDVHVTEHAHDIVNLLGRDIGGEYVVDFVEGQKAFFLAEIDQLLDFIQIFLSQSIHLKLQPYG